MPLFVMPGICFSGGGIRAASYMAGVMESLEDNNLLHLFDYMSSVSGGGYVLLCVAKGALWKGRWGWRLVDGPVHTEGVCTCSIALYCSYHRVMIRTVSEAACWQRSMMYAMNRRHTKAEHSVMLGGRGCCVG